MTFRQRRTAEFKLQAVERTKALGKGGVGVVSKELNIHHTTISKWRQEEQGLRQRLGRTTDDNPLTRFQQRLISIQEEKELAEWCKTQSGPLTQALVIGKLRESHPDIFTESAEVDAFKARKQANNWLYGFTKRYQLKPERPPRLDTKPAAEREEAPRVVPA